MKRRKGHAVLERLAYIGRRRLVSARTGEVYDYTGRGDLEGKVETLLPPGALPQLAGASTLWSAVDAAATHEHAVLGLDLVLSLPPLDELDPELSRQLLESFLSATVVPHGLGASYAIHQPHGGFDTDELAADLMIAVDTAAADPFSDAMRAGRLHRHAHVLVTPRRVGALGLERRRYQGLDPTLRKGAVVDALEWGRLWGLHQNLFFAEHGLELRVRPRALFSAPKEPLPAVRKWRRKLLGDTDVVGRAMLINPEVEKANAEALRSIDSALETLERPFTRGELLALALRFLGAEEARELTDAVIGVAGVIELGDNSGAGSRWLASVDLVTTELAVIGRAAALAARSRAAAAIPDLGAGYSEPARALLRAVAAGPGLVVIDAYDDPATLLEDVARLAERTDRKPVSIAHGAGSTHPAAIIVKSGKLPTRPVSNAVMLVDQADALDAADLDLIIQATLAGNSQLVLFRRPAGLWPRTPLLDLLAQRALRLTWGRPVPSTPADRIRRGDFAAVVDKLARDRRIIGGRGTEIADAVIDWAATQAAGGRRGIVLAADADRVASLNERLQRAGLPAIATQYLPAEVTEPVLALVRRPARRGPLLAAQLTRAPDLVLLVDRDTTRTDADLLAHLALDLPLAAAITQGLAAWQLPPGSTFRRADPTLPGLAVNWAGTPTTDPAGIRELVAFWASAPLDLDWAGEFWVTDAEVLAALSTGTIEPNGRIILPVNASPVAGAPIAGPEPGEFASFEPSDDLSPDDLPDHGDADHEDDVGPDGPPPDDDWEERDRDGAWPEDDAPGPEDRAEEY